MVVVDPTLIGRVDVAKGLTPKGLIIAHSDKNPEELKGDLGVSDARVYTVNAMRIALDILGRPIYNTAMLGALLRVAPLAKMESLFKVVTERFPGAVGEKNIAVIKRAYEEVQGV